MSVITLALKCSASATRWAQSLFSRETRPIRKTGRLDLSRKFRVLFNATSFGAAGSGN